MSFVASNPLEKLLLLIAYVHHADVTAVQNNVQLSISGTRGKIFISRETSAAQGVPEVGLACVVMRAHALKTLNFKLMQCVLSHTLFRIMHLILL